MVLRVGIAVVLRPGGHSFLFSVSPCPRPAPTLSSVFLLFLRFICFAALVKNQIFFYA